MGATHFLTKTLGRVSTEMSLHVLAYNLKRVMKVLGIMPLMQAMRSSAAGSKHRRRAKHNPLLIGPLSTLCGLPSSMREAGREHRGRPLYVIMSGAITNRHVKPLE